MTTIAWDGKTLAVDSLEVCGSTITTNKKKKLFIGVGEYSAVCGCGVSFEVEEIVDWIDGGKTGDMPPLTESTIILIDANGAAFEIESGSKTPRKITAPSSSGSGWVVALASMDAGLDAVGAVKAAIKRDTYTGGRVQSYTVKGVE